MWVEKTARYQLRDINRLSSGSGFVQVAGAERRLDVVTATERGNVLGGVRKGCTIVLCGRTLAMATGFLCGPEQACIDTNLTTSIQTNLQT